jgi:hypothetical protein
MELTLKRIFKGPKYTIGHLFINGVYECDTLEPPYMGTKQTDSIEFIKSTKKGNTAIPSGVYNINMDIISPKFKDRSWAKPFGGKLPTIEDVPAFDRVLIHVGNKASQYGLSDTQACILVGENKVKGQVISSTACFTELMTVLLKAKLTGEKITLSIE